MGPTLFSMAWLPGRGLLSAWAAGRGSGGRSGLRSCVAPRRLLGVLLPPPSPPFSNWVSALCSAAGRWLGDGVPAGCCLLRRGTLPCPGLGGPLGAPWRAVSGWGLRRWLVARMGGRGWGRAWGWWCAPSCHPRGPVDGRAGGPGDHPGFRGGRTRAPLLGRGRRDGLRCAAPPPPGPPSLSGLAGWEAVALCWRPRGVSARLRGCCVPRGARVRLDAIGRARAGGPGAGIGDGAA